MSYVTRYDTCDMLWQQPQTLAVLQMLSWVGVGVTAVQNGTDRLTKGVACVCASNIAIRCTAFIECFCFN